MFPIHTMCHAFGVSRSGYYAWAGRRPSARTNADAVLAERITAIHKASKETYGAPRIHAELADEGVQVARKRVERLMKAARIAGVGVFAPPSATTGVARPAISSIATSTPMPRTRCGSPTSPTFRHAPAFCIWPSCWTPSRGASSAGRWVMI